ncbi:MAG: hypothetical protein WDZ48_04835, partial [Pirellulales bacterium]
QRRAVVIAVRRVDKTREELNKPPAPVQPGQPVEALGPTVGQNLIFALNDLTNAQNNLMSVVLNYYESRMLLYRTLGILELDNCGMWIDKPIEEAESLTEDQCPIPPNAPADWMQEAGVDPSDLHDAASEDGGTGPNVVLPREDIPAGEAIDAPTAPAVEPQDDQAPEQENGSKFRPHPSSPMAPTGQQLVPAGFLGESLRADEEESEETSAKKIQRLPSVGSRRRAILPANRSQ